MPFAYFDRLTRRQQAIYLQSDAVAALPLRRPERLRPLVTELARALESGDRRLTESATQLLATALARALGVPPVRVKVLAARPHARWGELHGLYETAGRRGEPPLITLWMRTARQKRVVAFRTYLRTLLPEVGPHGDCSLLRLGGCFQTIMAMDEPRFLPVEPDRWAADRQYLRNDGAEALETFRTRRDESLKFLLGLPPDQWERGGIHATRGRMTIKDFVALMAWHDD